MLCGIDAFYIHNDTGIWRLCVVRDTQWDGLFIRTKCSITCQRLRIMVASSLWRPTQAQSGRDVDDDDDDADDENDDDDAAVLWVFLYAIRMFPMYVCQRGLSLLVRFFFFFFLSTLSPRISNKSLNCSHAADEIESHSSSIAIKMCRGILIW